MRLMDISTIQPGHSRRGQLAFSIVEVCISVAILAIMLVSLYGGMSSSFAVVQGSRENLRATQIMLERMEGLRLYNWNQLVYSNMIPTTFTNYYYPLAAPGESKGIMYCGTMSIDPVTLNPPATYSGNMRAITVTVYWTNYYGSGLSQQIVHSRSMTTYTARDGIQNYVYYN
jgi:type II secretory pathway pseudopilin PulG